MKRNEGNARAATGVALAFILLVAGTALQPRETAAANPEILRTALACDIDCDECPYAAEHWLNGGEGYSDGGFFHGDCLPGTNCGAIHQCNESRGPGLDSIWKTYAAAAPSELPVVLQTYPDFVHFAPARGAIQILDCQGQVFAHVPLNAAQLKAVVE